MGLGQARDYKEFKYPVGVTCIRPVALNPTKAQLAKLGINFEKEPEYTKVDEETNDTLVFTKLYFTVEDKRWKDNKTVYSVSLQTLSSAEDVSKSGKTNFINNRGMSSYSNSKEELIDRIQSNDKVAKFHGGSEESYRPAYKGEVVLIDFIKTLLNLKKEDECYVEKWDSIVEGDLSEIQEAVLSTDSEGNVPTIHVLLGVKIADNGRKSLVMYRKVFTKAKAISKFEKALGEPYGDFRAEYPVDLELTVFEEKAKGAEPSSDDIEDDDIPF